MLSNIFKMLRMLFFIYNKKYFYIKKFSSFSLFEKKTFKMNEYINIKTPLYILFTWREFFLAMLIFTSN
jgi:hypothetical protein